MIGHHSLRLYCPRGNIYQWDAFSIFEEEDGTENNIFVFGAISAGPDTNLLDDMDPFEEHCVAVCTQLVWSHIGSKG
jgi:hypothetical protein